jgi:hypothetical protein
LTKLAQELGMAPLDTLLAYSSGIYPSLYTGQYPDQTGFWTEFIKRDTPSAPWTSLFRLLPGKSLPRKVAYVAGRVAKLLALSAPDNLIPPFLQKWFDRLPVHYENLPPVELDSPRLITRQFEQAGLRLEYLHCEHFNSQFTERCIQAAPRTDTLIICLTELDHYGHIFGPLTPTFGETLFVLDTAIASLLADLRATQPDFKLYALSDHGMTPVTSQFDAWEYLEKAGFRLGRDYLAFINSTVMSVWYEGGNRAAIVSQLNRSGYGRVLTEAERAKYHLNFLDHRYGDDLFLAAEGIEFIPNFLSLAWKHNAGMHGYDPACASTHAFLIGSNQIEALPADIVGFYNVMTAMCTL